MNLPSPWAGIKIMYGIKHSSLITQKEVVLKKSS
jgi:hypothetical protein